MNFQNILNEIEKFDPDFQDRINPRRSAIKNITSFGSKIAAAAVPFYLGTMLNRVYAQTGAVPTVAQILNYALKLEYLEYEFYNTGVNTPGLIPTGSGMQALSTIRDHESAHVNFLFNTMTALNAGPAARSSQGFGATHAYDFSGGNGVGQSVVPGVGTGPFNGVFQNYDTFLALAQAFEDTGVRAYKGQAGNVLSYVTTRNSADVPFVALNYALRIHSVEARHASHLRQMRKARGVSIKPWITGANDTGVGPAGPNFAGEDNVIQPTSLTTTLDITKLPSVASSTSTTTSVATECFDEPLTMAQVLPLVTIFGVM